MDERGPAAFTSAADQRAAHPSIEIVHAAGGIVVRSGPGQRGVAEIAVVHRPHRADWTFPKGKLETGETFEECALREVLEETGLECRLLAFAGHTEYRDRRDRLKVVAYWTMATTGGGLQPNWEVDEVRWVTPEAAASLLSYERDRDLLASLAPLAPSTVVPGGA